MQGGSPRNVHQDAQTSLSPDPSALQKFQIGLCYRATCDFCTSNLDIANPNASFSPTGRLAFLARSHFGDVPVDNHITLSSFCQLFGFSMCLMRSGSQIS